MPEFDFHSASIDEIGAAFRSDGCVLLRHFAATGDLARLREAIDGAAPPGSLHFNDSDMRARGLPHFCDYLFADKHRALVESLVGAGFRVSSNTVTRRIDAEAIDIDVEVGGGDGYQQPLPPHLDAFFHRFVWTINFWVPFRDCGRDAPSLGVVCASADETKAFTGYDGRKRRAGPPPKWNFANFSNAGFAVDDLRTAFGERVWTPEYELGDAMLLSNWTLHFTHALPEMTERRGNVELRFTGRAGLGEALLDAVRPAAAKLLSVMRHKPSPANAQPRSH